MAQRRPAPGAGASIPKPAHLHGLDLAQQGAGGLGQPRRQLLLPRLRLAAPPLQLRHLRTQQVFPRIRCGALQQVGGARRASESCELMPAMEALIKPARRTAGALICCGALRQRWVGQGG